MRFSAVGLALLAVAGALPMTGCKARPAGVEAASPPAADTAPAKAAAAKATPAAAPAAPLLAYAYRFAIEAPAQGVSAMAQRHEQECVAAGPQLCQVIRSDVGSQDGEITGSLQLRAVPSWIAGFRGRLEREVGDAKGRVVSQKVEAEDLTRSIVDTGAALRAKALLRDRLEKLLAGRPGKLADVLELEKTVAQVQGEIDATQSELAAMQARVQMSDLTLIYRTKGGALDPRATRTLGAAFGGFFDHAVGVTAALVTLVSYLLPLAAVGALGWAILTWIRRRQRPTSPPPAAQA